MRWIALLFLLAANSYGLIQFDSASSNFGSGTTLSWSHTVSGPSTILIVGVNSKGVSTSSVTFNGVAMTSITARGYGTSSQVSQWYLVNPDAGAHTVFVTLTGSASGPGSVEGGSISLNWVDQNNPIEAINTSSGTGTSAAVSVTTLAENAWTTEILGEDGGLVTFVITGGQTQRWSRPEITAGAVGSTKGPVSPPGSTTISWNITLGGSVDWAENILSLVPAVLPYDPTLLMNSE